jgi:hypothetical protein
MLVMLAISMYGAFADPVPPSLQEISSSTRTISGISNISAQGGNVTEIRIDALTVTKTWQGYFGNITGNIHLDDASNNSFYIWGNATGVSGEVYASRNSTINWASVNCTNATQRSSENAYLGVAGVDGDSVTNTFNSTYHPTFIVGLQTIQNSTCFSTNAFVNGTSQNSSFYQILLSDQYNNTVYTTLIENDKHAYNGRVSDFQLMVGENEHDGNLGPTAYYFFVELS